MGGGSKVGARRRSAQFPQYPPQGSPPVVLEASESMYHEEGNGNMTEDEKDFRKALFDMKNIIKVLYGERNTRLQGEMSRPPRVEGSLGAIGNGNGDKPPYTPPSSSPPYSPSSSSSSPDISLTHQHT